MLPSAIFIRDCCLMKIAKVVIEALQENLVHLLQESPKDTTLIPSLAAVTMTLKDHTHLYEWG